MEDKMRRNLTLSEGEQLEILVDDCEVAEAKKQGNNCLIGKIWAGKRINRDGFVRVFKRIWRTDGEVAFKEVQPNVWMFEFSQEGDKQRVLAGRPWSFDRFIIALSEFDGSIPSSQWDFTTSPFWIQIHDMPLICMTKAIGSKIGESLGILEEVDIEGDKVEWGSVLRIRVVIDLQKPLERGRALTIAGKAHWVSFQYENLPVFCFNCGRIVHGNNGCPVQSSHVEEKQWGVWLRAGKMKQQGLGKGGWRPEMGNQNGHDSGRIPNGGSTQTGKESHGYGGNPTPPHQTNKERIMDDQLGTIGHSKPAGGGNFLSAKEGKAEIMGTKQGKTNSQAYGDELVMQEQAVHPKPARENNISSSYEETTELTGNNNGKLKVQAKVGELAQEKWTELVANSKRTHHGGPGPTTNGPNNWGSLSEGAINPGNKTHDNGLDGNGKKLMGQPSSLNNLKIWKKVVRIGEEETPPASSINTLLGKRKGETEINNNDEERHLKIRKWEDYLEEEVESENELAEAAEQPRLYP
jgi:hypothetical protein